MKRLRHLYVYPFIVLLPILLLLYLGSVEADVYAAGPGQQQAPFSVSRNILSFTGVEGGPNPRAQRFGVINTGSEPINWSVSAEGNAAWLNVVPTSGLDDRVVGVSVDTTGLISGTFTETLTVSAQETPAIEVISVTLVITSEVIPLYAGDFEAYAPDANPVGWLDTGTDDSYEYTERMRMAAADGGSGVTFLSQSPQADESLPFAHGHDPAPGAVNVDPSSDVVVHVADSGEGVDLATLAMSVGSVPVSPTVTGSLYDYTLTYDPPLDFDEGDVVTVTVDACDLAVPANCMDTEVYSFAVRTMPDIDVWYGSHQVFGDLGNTQRWVNVLGNVSDPDGMASLTYSLNGGPESPLSMGTDNPRLVAEGDFNVDIAYTDLISGLNPVVITATDHFNNQTVETVTVEYVSGNVWPEPYSIDWSTVTAIPDVAQIVDGLWTKEADSVRPEVTGYDRLVAIGDMTWDDYEVTVPITVHEIDSTQSNRPAVGILMRWQGHYDWYGWQPRVGWWPMGAIGMYRWYNDTLGPRFQIYINSGAVRIDDTSGRELEFEVCYNFKMRVETIPGQEAGLYSFKAWEDGESEPSGWDLTHQAETGLENGSFLLFAHHVNASFGDVTVTPIHEYTLTVNEVGRGSVDKDPDQTTYDYGDVVTLTATADPGWTFAGWSGALSGTDTPVTMTITGNTVVTATFSQDEYTLMITPIGDGGAVIVEPDQATYRYNDVVTLTATVDPGWTFAGWSGALSGSDNPATTTITGNTVVTATFTQNEYVLTVTAVGSGSVDKDPDQASYPYGDVVTLTATADPGWTFAGWSGALSGTEITATITITGNTTVTATFSQDEYTLTVNKVGSGLVDRDPDQATYHYGDVVTLTATMDPGWSFVGWSGALSGTDTPMTMTITGNTVVTATFSQDEYTLMITPIGDGGAVIVEPDQATYHYGDVVTLTATVDPGWTFAGWSGDLSGSGNPATITMYGSRTVTATFTQGVYTLTVDTVGSGSVAKDPNQTTYHYGDVVTLTATVDPGWTFAGWSGDLSGSDNPATITMYGSRTVTATFTQDKHQIFLPLITIQYSP